MTQSLLESLFAEHNLASQGLHPKQHGKEKFPENLLMTEHHHTVRCRIKFILHLIEEYFSPSLPRGFCQFLPGPFQQVKRNRSSIC